MIIGKKLVTGKNIGDFTFMGTLLTEKGTKITSLRDINSYK